MGSWRIPYASVEVHPLLDLLRTDHRRGLFVGPSGHDRLLRYMRLVALAQAAVLDSSPLALRLSAHLDPKLAALGGKAMLRRLLAHLEAVERAWEDGERRSRGLEAARRFACGVRDAGIGLPPGARDLAARVAGALRGHDAPLPDSDLIQRQLARTPWHLFGSPDYLGSAGAPERPADLPRHACLVVPNRSDETAWTLRHPDAGEVRLDLTPRLASDDLQAIKAAALDHLGIAALPAYLCSNEAAAGRLRQVLPGWTTGDARLTLLTPSRRGQLPAVRALVDFLVTEYPAMLSADHRPPARKRKPRHRRT